MTRNDRADPPPLGLDEISRRLAQIDEILAGPAHEPSPNQFSLLRERDQLRNLARLHRIGKDEGRSTEQLRAEMGALRLRLKDEAMARTGFMTSKGGGSSSPSSGAWVALGAAARDAGGMDRIQSRISEIEAELQRREGLA